MARFMSAMRDFFTAQQELQERLLLLNQPWQEEYLHWAANGELHGAYHPSDGRRRATTRGGWCIRASRSAGQA